MKGDLTCVCNKENCWFDKSQTLTVDDIDYYRRRSLANSPRIVAAPMQAKNARNTRKLAGCDESEDPRFNELGFCDCDAFGDCDFIYYDEIEYMFESGSPYRHRNMKGDLKRKVKLHGRYVNCFEDPDYEDPYGYCDCWEDARGREICGYWEYCEHNDKDVCSMRPKSTLPSQRRNLGSVKPKKSKIPEFDCNKMGASWKTPNGYCECDVKTFSCEWITYADQI